MLEFEVRNAGSVAGRFARAAATIDDRAFAVTRHYGAVLRERVRAAAPHRTGRYAGRIRMDTRGSGESRWISVSSPDPFARRLEKGFVGVDSAGREYHQAPRPHWQPAIDVTGPEYAAALTLIADDI